MNALKFIQKRHGMVDVFVSEAPTMYLMSAFRDSWVVLRGEVVQVKPLVIATAHIEIHLTTNSIKSLSL